MELSTLHGLGTSQHREAFPALVLQPLPAVALLGDALGDALPQPFQPLRLALVLGLQGVDGLRSGLDHGLVFALKLLPARFHPARLLALRHQLRVPGSERLLRCLGRLATRKALRDAGMVYNCMDLAGDARTGCQASLAQPYQQKGLLQDAMKSAAGRLSQIQSLMGQINATSDQKAVQEIQARIGAENALLAHEMSQVQMLQGMADSEERIARSRERERQYQMLARTGKVADYLP